MKRIAALLLTASLFATVAAPAAPWQNTAARRAQAAQQQRQEAQQEYRQSLHPRIELVPSSPNVIVGKVVRVNPQQRFAVGWLHSRYINLNGHLITRNERLETTAVLSVGTARNNRAAGLNIESGMPQTGDEIVIASTVSDALPPAPRSNARTRSGAGTGAGTDTGTGAGTDTDAGTRE